MKKKRKNVLEGGKEKGILHVQDRKNKTITSLQKEGGIFGRVKKRKGIVNKRF